MKLVGVSEADLLFAILTKRYSLANEVRSLALFVRSKDEQLLIVADRQALDVNEAGNLIIIIELELDFTLDRRRGNESASVFKVLQGKHISRHLVGGARECNGEGTPTDRPGKD